MAITGLLEGLANGLQQGTEAYISAKKNAQQQKNIQDEMALRKQQLASQMYNEGTTTDENGNIVPTETGKIKQQAAEAENRRKIRNLTPSGTIQTQDSSNSAQPSGLLTTPKPQDVSGTSLQDQPKDEDNYAATGITPDEFKQMALASPSVSKSTGLLPSTNSPQPQPKSQANNDSDFFRKAYENEGLKIPEGGSIQDIQDVVAELGKLKNAQATQALAKTRLGLAAGNADERKNKNATQAGIEFDKTASPFRKVINALDRSRSLLTSKDSVLTGKDFNAANMDYITGLTQGGQVSEGKVNREISENVGIELTNLYNKYARPDGKLDLADVRKQSPGLVENLLSHVDQVRNDWSSAMEDAVSDLHSSYLDSSNPKVLNTVKRKLGVYSPNYYREFYHEAPPPKSSGILNQGGTKESKPSGLLSNPSNKGAQGAHSPGSIVNVKGKNYKVGPDGDSLIPVQ